MFSRIVIGLAVAAFGQLALANQTVSLIHDSSDHLILTFVAKAPTVTVNPIEAVDYATLAIPGYTNIGRIGGPALPTVTKLIAVPHGKRAVIAASSKEKGTFRLKAPIAPFTGVERHCGDRNNGVKPNEDRYKKFRSDPIFELGEPSYIGPIKVVSVTFNPVRASHSSEKLTLIRKAVLRINFERDNTRTVPPINPSGLAADDYPFFRALVLNNGAFPRFARSKSLPTDLIIVHAAYMPTIQKLVRFKEAQGRGVVLRPYTDPSSSEIMSYIREKYRSSNPPENTLIVGNIDQIPSYRRGSFWTDYNYSLLDSGPYPDISIGRIAANNADELDAMLDKIIARESMSRANGRFLVTSGFETTWCQENLGYIMNTILSNAQTDISVDRRYASDGHRTDSIVEGFNNNPNIIIYDGHGNQDGMTELPLYRRHLTRLSNTSFPIVLDIACLNSKWPSSGATQTNFADRISTLSGSGVAGIMASSYYSGGHDLFRHILRAAVFDENSTNEPYHNINQIGRMIHYGKVKYLEQYAGDTSALDDNYMFYYHGDPATTFFGETK